MSYVIKDIEKKYWLGIDRVIDNNDNIVTVVEPIYSYKAATKFDSIDECTDIMKEIKAEGNYDIPAYATENVEELEAEEKKAKEEADENLRKAAQKKLDSIINDLKAKGLSDEEIRKELSNGFVVSNEEVEQVKEEEDV
ncbi:MAG: hypothetical protein J5691_00965 [Bacilli bacterium]|nr:hypothetical protein [Bacilli bacterium]